uniref:Uncharacterized protein n=1 Tax=Compsopogon caeruleus TaxID=31354 RepID=A0A7S1XEQ9_9RHOD
MEDVKLALDEALQSRNLESLTMRRRELADWKANWGDEAEGALERVLDCSFSDFDSNVARMIDELTAENKAKAAALAEAQERESLAFSVLVEAFNAQDLCEIEKGLEIMAQALLSERSDVASQVDTIRKSFVKTCKAERKKLKQIADNGDLEDIDSALQAALRLNLRALEGDIRSLQDVRDLKYRRRAVLSECQQSKEEKNITKLNEIRLQLNSLGMFSEAEEARRVIETLQRELRLTSAVVASVDTLKQSSANIKDWMEGGECKWPDCTKLVHLLNRAERTDVDLGELRVQALEVLTELESAAIDVLRKVIEEDNPRLIASSVEGFRKAFAFDRRDIGLPDSADCDLNAVVESGLSRIAYLQVVEQEKIMAETERVKREVALADARNFGLGSRSSASTPSSVSELTEANGEQLGSIVERGRDIADFYGEAPGAHRCEMNRSGRCKRCGRGRPPEVEEFLETTRSRLVLPLDAHISITVNGGSGVTPMLRDRQGTLTDYSGPLYAPQQAAPVQQRILIPRQSQVPSPNNMEYADANDLSVESFANENFGFDIDSIVDER